MTSESIAIIGAVSTVVAGFGGVALGAFFSYRVGSNLMTRQELNVASAKLRAAFAPAQAKIRLAKNTGEFNLKEFFDDAILQHAAAFEEFIPFVSDTSAYQKTWEVYWKTIYDDDALADAAHRWLTGKVISDDGKESYNFLEVINNKINSILRFANPQN